MSSIRTKIISFAHSLITSTPKAILTAAFILAISHVAYAYVVRTGVPSVPEAGVFAGKPIDSSDYIDGNSKNDVFVVEYSDPECPYCVSLHPTMKLIRTEYGEKVAFVYRHFPLTQIHPHAYDESKAIACAGTLGGKVKFYEFIDSMYGYKASNQTIELPSTGKEDIAKNVGLDAAAFATCMASTATGNAIDASLNDGALAGVTGTPSTFILKKSKGGYKVIARVDGARPYEYIKAAVDQALAQ